MAASGQRRSRLPPCADPIDLVSKHEPSHQEECVVVLGVASEAVVIGPTAVEIPIRGVLKQQAHIAAWQPVDLGDVAAGLRAPECTASYRNPGVVEAVISASACAEVRQRGAVLVVVVIAGLASKRSQPVRRIAGAAGGKGCVEILLLVDPVQLRREAMTVGDVLVLRVERHVEEAVGGPGRIRGC